MLSYFGTCFLKVSTITLLPSWSSGLRLHFPLQGGAGAGSIPDQGVKIPCALWPKNQNLKLKQYCSKFDEDFKKWSSLKKKKFLKKKKPNSTPSHALHLSNCPFVPRESPPCPGLSQAVGRKGQDTPSHVFRPHQPPPRTRAGLMGHQRSLARLL